MRSPQVRAIITEFENLKYKILSANNIYDAKDGAR